MNSGNTQTLFDENFFKDSEKLMRSIRQSEKTQNVVPTLSVGVRNLNLAKEPRRKWSDIARKLVRENNLTKENIREFKEFRNYDERLKKAIYHELNRLNNLLEAETQKNQLSLFSQSPPTTAVKEKKRLKIDTELMFKKLSFMLPGLMIAVFLVGQSSISYRALGFGVVVSIIMPSLIEYSIIKLNGLKKGKKDKFALKEVLKWSLFLFSCFTISLHSFLGDENYKAFQGAKLESLEALDKKVLRLEGEFEKVALVRDNKIKSQAYFKKINHHSKSEKLTPAVNEAQRSVDLKSNELDLARREKAMYLEKSFSPLGYTIRTYLLVFGEVILQFVSMFFYHRAGREKNFLSFEKVRVSG